VPCANQGAPSAFSAMTACALRPSHSLSTFSASVAACAQITAALNDIERRSPVPRNGSAP